MLLIRCLVGYVNTVNGGYRFSVAVYFIKSYEPTRCLVRRRFNA